MFFFGQAKKDKRKEQVQTYLLSPTNYKQAF